MICLSVSRSPHASATPSSVASISTRRACATSLKHSSPCTPRPTASPPPTSPLACAFSANKALLRTAPATLPTISKNSAANRSFSGSPTLAGTAHSRPASAQWPPSWCFATKPSNPCSLPLNLSTQPAAHTTPDPSTPTTVPYRLPCMASSTSSALPLEYRQFFCRASPLSAYGGGKSVIIADPRRDKTPALLEAMGRLVEDLGGRYIIADDVGTTLADLVVMREVTRYTAAATAAAQQALPETAFGVFEALGAAAEVCLGRHDLEGLRVAVQGLGNVGMPLCGYLAAAGATLVVSDLDLDRCDQAAIAYGATVVEPEAIYTQHVDVFAPAALGGVLNDATN